MNIDYLHEGLECLLYTCRKLTPKQTFLIEQSLIILREEQRCSGMYFWGRMDGVDEDYYIAFGCTEDYLKDRRYFYSTNQRDWQPLPFIDSPKIFEAATLCLTQFVGDPSVVTNVKLDPEFEIAGGRLVRILPREVVKLKEEDRLAALVFIITEESAICPRGALYKLVDGRVVPNKYFRGLNELQIQNFTYYQLSRLPRNDLKTNLSKRTDYNYPIDFLDTIDGVIPYNKAFALVMEREGRVAVICSLIWLGMCFFHKLDSHKHGFVYFGEGRKNRDLLFKIEV